MAYKIDITGWRERPVLSLRLAAEIAGVSVASIYRQNALGNLAFRSVAGRTMVDTDSFIEMVHATWQPQTKTQAATNSRKAKKK